MKNYTFVQRSVIKKQIDFFDKNIKYNFNVPLNGFSDYNQSIKIGDIVSVIYYLMKEQK